MTHRAGRRRVYDFFPARDRRRQASRLAPYLGEECGKAKKVILSPSFERMMMALGTFQPYPQEQLADNRREFFRLAPIAKQRGRPVTPCAPLSGYQSAHHL